MSIFFLFNRRHEVKYFFFQYHAVIITDNKILRTIERIDKNITSHGSHGTFSEQVMLRISEKLRYQDELLSIIYRRQLTAEIRLCTADDDTDEIEDDIGLVYFSQYSYLLNRRYIFRSPYRSRNSVWREMLYNNNNILTDTEFLSHFRVM